MPKPKERYVLKCIWILLLSFAYLIATYSFVATWILLFVFKSKKLNWGFKTAIALLVASVFTLTSHLLVFALSEDGFDLVDLFYYDGGVADYSANGIIFGYLIAGA